MKTLERRKKIIDLLNDHGEIKIKEISKITKEGEDKIRRDIRILSNYGILKSVYGGVKKVINIEDVIEKLFYYDGNNIHEKNAIAEKALEQIKEGESIYLGAGSTTYKLASLLYRLDIKLDIITISLPIAVLLSKNKGINIILIGGKLTKENFSFEGQMASEYLKFYNINKAFVGMRGFNLDHGFTIPTMDQVKSIRAIVEYSSEVIVLADYSKFGLQSLMKVGTFEDGVIKDKMRMLITNKKCNEKYINKLKAEGMEVILV